ncbi:MAG: histidine phosphatase family protein [Actinobacteria bacterium]|nr:histidine phosphatase family protein [Actinomycetota bacterium]
MPRDEPATGQLPDLSGWLGPRCTTVTSPAARCRVSGAAVEAMLHPWDLGGWAGLPVADVPDLHAWRTDPSYDHLGGESLLALLDRAQTLLGQWHDDHGRLAAVTHGAVVRAAVVVALHAPPQAFWDLDVAPGAVTELHSSGPRWRVSRVNCALHPR